MKFRGTAKNIYQAYRFIKGNFTKKQINEAALAIEVTPDAVTLVSVGENAYFKSVIQEAVAMEEGIMQVDFDFIDALADRRSEMEYEIVGDEEEIYALEPGGERMHGIGVEIEMELEDIQPLAVIKQEDLTSLMTELLSNTVKTGRAFTDTLLLRLRHNQLNGRAISMQAIVVDSIQVETDNQGLVDMYFSKPQAQAINKAIKLMNKKQPMTILKNASQVGVQSGADTVVLLEHVDSVGMPDITPLVKRCFSLKKEEAVIVKVDEWKTALNQLQKDTAEEDREFLKKGIQKDGSFADQPEDAHALIDVKTTLKLIRALQAKEVELHLLENAIVFRYTEDTRTHLSVLMTGKE